MLVRDVTLQGGFRAQHLAAQLAREYLLGWCPCNSKTKLALVWSACSVATSRHVFEQYEILRVLAVYPLTNRDLPTRTQYYCSQFTQKHWGYTDRWDRFARYLYFSPYLLFSFGHVFQRGSEEWIQAITGKNDLSSVWVLSHFWRSTQWYIVVISEHSLLLRKAQTEIGLNRIATHLETHYPTIFWRMSIWDGNQPKNYKLLTKFEILRKKSQKRFNSTMSVSVLTEL